MKNCMTLLFLIFSTLGFSQSQTPINQIRTLNEINEYDLADAYPWLNADGLHLYYTKEFSHGSELVYSERKETNSDFSEPRVVETGVIGFNSGWLTDDELSMYATTIENLYFLSRTNTNEAFGTKVKIELTGSPDYTFLTSASSNLTQDQLFISLLNAFDKSLKIAEFRRVADHSYEFVKYVDAGLDLQPRMGRVSGDGKHMCFTTKDESGKENIYIISRKQPKGDFDRRTLRKLEGFDNLGGQPSQVVISSNFLWLMGVVTNDRLWQNNDLFIAQLNGSITSVSESSFRTALEVYPNPSDGAITIATEVGVQVEVINSVGQQIDSFIASSEMVQYQIEEKGMFIIRVLSSNGVKMQKVVVR